jgi:hypothetical protein
MGIGSSHTWSLVGTYFSVSWYCFRQYNAKEVDLVSVDRDRLKELNKIKEVVFIAREFHKAYEKKAPLFGYKTRKASAVPWKDVPDNNKMLMMETVNDLIERGIVSAGPKVKGRVQVRKQGKAISRKRSESKSSQTRKSDSS